MARIASTGLAALLLATAWCGVCVCTPKWGDDLVWTKGTRALDEDVVTATLGLRHCNLQDLRTVVERVSSPSSHEYGNHLSIQQLRDILECKHGERPVDVVRAWIARHTALADRRLDAAMRVQPSGDWVTLSLPSRDAEALFGVNFFRYRAQAKAKASARRQGRTLRRVSHGVWADTMVRVPSPIAHVVDVVLGVSPSPRSQHAYHIHTDDPAPSRATRPHGATASPTSTTTTSNAPNLMGVLSSDTTMYLQFMPQCLDGSPAMSDLCATSSPPAITGFTVRQTVNGTTTSHVMQTCGGNSLSHAHSMDASSGAVICQNQLATPGPFLLVNITLATEYADGSASASADGGGAIFTTPFVDTSLASIFYGLPKPDASGAPFSVYNQSVVEFSHNFFSFQELDEFFSFNNLNTDVSVGVVGPNDGSSPEGEANQDVQWIMGIGQRVDTVFWSTKNVNGFILDWLEAVASTPNNVVPRVFSISYGNPEGLTNKQYGDNYIQRGEIEFMKLAARGISVTVADGDSGASSALGCNKFWPEWPASSAYVTSCGGATISSYSLPSTAVAVGSRTGVSYTTGGGFSNVFPRPSYQDRAVKAYLQSNATSHLPPSSLFNASGRAFPDVSLLGYNLLTFYANQNWINPFPGGGTSFSAPLMGGMISLMNKQRADAGLPPMGLINHWLYSVWQDEPDAFYDIVVGDNACVAGGIPCCPFGYHCVPGYDAVSGLGHPHFSKLASLVNRPFLARSQKLRHEAP